MAAVGPWDSRVRAWEHGVWWVVGPKLGSEDLVGGHSQPRSLDVGPEGKQVNLLMCVAFITLPNNPSVKSSPPYQIGCFSRVLSQPLRHPKLLWFLGNPPP